MRRCRSGYRSWTPRRDWTHFENGSLAVSAAFGSHAIEPSVNKNHVVDWLRAIVIIRLPTKTVKALVIVAIGIDHEDRAQVIVAAVGGRAVKFVADQEKRSIGILAIVMSLTKLMKQVER